jgi:hypothetical protein
LPAGPKTSSLREKERKKKGVVLGGFSQWKLKHGKLLLAVAESRRLDERDIHGLPQPIV